jgi:hypothetical protein
VYAGIIPEGRASGNRLLPSPKNSQRNEARQYKERKPEKELKETGGEEFIHPVVKFQLVKSFDFLL